MQAGTIETHRFEGDVLKSNPLKDPHVRELAVYLPPGYSASNSKGYPAVFCLIGYGGTGRMFLNVDPFMEGIDKRDSEQFVQSLQATFGLRRSMGPLISECRKKLSQVREEIEQTAG